jgi:hypothetical protein
MATPLPLSVLPPPPGRVFRTRPSRGLPPAREKSWLRSRPPQGVILRGLNGVTVWLHLRRGLHALCKRAAGLSVNWSKWKGGCRRARKSTSTAMDMTPLKLTDSEMDIILAAARPLAVQDRDGFRQPRRGHPFAGALSGPSQSAIDGQIHCACA